MAKRTFIRKVQFANLAAEGRLRNEGTERDYSVREFIGRDGSTVQVLEEFLPTNGHLVNVFWKG